MGIQGLLPLLEKASSSINVSEFSGCVAVVDAYCWIHRGCYSCADKLFLNEETDQYVIYCINRAELLINRNIKPILVFDGHHLTAKKVTEVSRQILRHNRRQKINLLLSEGNESQARELMKSCVSVTQQMAKKVINACRDNNIDYIVAPYEADAQIAYLIKEGFADFVVTEDSDLLVYNCKQCFYKLDVTGNGKLIDMSKFNICFGDKFSFEKFRYMCILSGCDYLPSLPGIGLGTAKKFFKMTANNNLNKVLYFVPNYLKKKVKVTKEYVDNFIKANNTFLYQLVFDPISRKLVPLNSYADDLDVNDLSYAGEYFDNELAFQFAIGNVDVNTLQIIDDYTVEDNSLWSKKWFQIKSNHNSQSQKFPKRSHYFKENANNETNIKNLNGKRKLREECVETCNLRKHQKTEMSDKNGFASCDHLMVEYSEKELVTTLSAKPSIQTTINTAQKITRNIFKVETKSNENNVIVQSRYFTNRSIEAAHSQRVTHMKLQLIQNGKRCQIDETDGALNSSGNTSNSSSFDDSLCLSDNSDFHNDKSDDECDDTKTDIIDISDDCNDKFTAIKSSPAVYGAFKKHDIRNYFK